MIALIEASDSKTFLCVVLEDMDKQLILLFNLEDLLSYLESFSISQLIVLVFQPTNELCDSVSVFPATGGSCFHQTSSDKPTVHSAANSRQTDRDYLVKKVVHLTAKEADSSLSSWWRPNQS